MIIPFKCDGVRLTSPYGRRTLNGADEYHYGYDLVGVGSAEVVCAVGGTVAQSRIVTDKNNLTREWGNYVCVKTDTGQYHYYCHLKRRAVSKGQRINAGDKIGIMGATGKAYGAHLHFEVRLADRKTAVDPSSVLGIPNKVGTYTVSSLESDLEILTNAGIINSPEYWLNNADVLAYQRNLYHNMAEYVRRKM